MAELHPALASALAGDRPLLFGAVEIVLPDATLRLLDGAGEVPIGGEVFRGRDPAWGVLDTIKGLSDSVGDQAPTVTLGMIPSSDLALEAMLDPAIQGSPVTVLVGCLNIATGLPIGEPYVPFAGELDVVTVKWGERDRRLELKCTSIAERLFVIEEGRRLSDAFHQLVWPGELGLAFVTGVETYVPFGQALKTDQVQVRSNL